MSKNEAKGGKTPKKIDKSTGEMSPKMASGLSRFIEIVADILKALHVAGIVVMILISIFGFTYGAFPGASGDTAELAESIQQVSEDVSVYGFEAEVIKNGAIDFDTLGWFGVGGAIIMALMMMVFQNIGLITKNARENTPFDKDNMRMVKEIGIFFIAVPVIGLIFNTIITIATGAETAVGFGGLLMGLIMLYLTQLFGYGAKLEDDTKGLI